MKTVGIIITAFKAEKYIFETINSLITQRLPVDWNVKFYIGVDACVDTANVLDNNISYYYTKENVGTYILTNSLLEEAKKDGCKMFVRFDSDDVAAEDFLYNGIKNTEINNFTSTVFIPCDYNLIPLKSKEPRWAQGSMFFSKQILDLVGGFSHYRVSCDKYFNLRIKSFGYKGRCKNPPKYFYRISENSLSHSNNTKINSEYRKNIEKELEEMLSNSQYSIIPVTTKLVYNHY